MKRIPVIDLARTFSILAVLSVHLGQRFITHPSSPPFLAALWWKLWYNGALGVAVFFVVSGFVITRLIASNPRGLFQPDFRDFYARRFGRIVPLLSLSIVLGMIALSIPHAASQPYETCIKNPHASFSPPFWISICTFWFNWFQQANSMATPNYGLHWDLLWSLSVEEQFYLFYPLVLNRLGNMRKLVVFLTVIIFFPPLFNVLQLLFSPRHILLDIYPLQPYSWIAMGCLLYLVTERMGARLNANKAESLYFCLSGLALFLLNYFHRDYKADFWNHAYGFTCVGFGAFFFILGGIYLDFFGSKGWKWLGFPGQLSYGGYLLHPLILFFLWPFLEGKNEYLAFLLFTGAVVAIAYLSYRFFEMPANLFFRNKWGRPARLLKQPLGQRTQ